MLYQKIEGSGLGMKFEAFVNANSSDFGYSISDGMSKSSDPYSFGW
jgi:hypothetical protein